MSRAIPEGFRLASGWRKAKREWRCNRPGCRADALYLKSYAARRACADHAVEMGALVPVAPVVEAPRPHGWNEARSSAHAMRWCDFSDGTHNVHCDNVTAAILASKDAPAELTRLRAALATAEQRAANLEERWGEAAARATEAEQRAAAAEDKLERIEAIVQRAEPNCGCDEVADILREGT